MKKRVSIILVLALAMIWLLSAAAHADLERGNSGEEVMLLQRMLSDLGYLFEEPDGQYGAKTETAVKEYQKSFGLEESGKVTDDLMSRICQDWADYQSWIYEQMRTDAGENYSPFCYTWEDSEGVMITQHCQKHALLWKAAEEMLASGDAESALYSYYEWLAEVISLYAEWISLVDEPVQAEIEAGKSLCLQLMDLQLKAMHSSYDANGKEIDPTDVYYGAELWMRDHCAWLCQMLNTLVSE